MKITILLLLVLLLPIGLRGQNVLGYSAKEVKSFFNQNHPEMVLESNFRNDHYKYLKYTDGESGLMTVLVFLSKRNRCTAIRIIYDLSLESRVINDLNRKYQKFDSSRWIDNSKGKKALIDYKKEEWFITVNFKPA